MSGATLLLTPLRLPIEPHHPRAAVDILEPRLTEQMLCAYRTSTTGELFDYAATLECRVCTVPQVLRPPGLVWPACPVHDRAIIDTAMRETA